MDMIAQNEAADGRADLSFTVVRDELPSALRAVDEAVREIGAEGCDYDENVSKISVVGMGMATRPGVAGAMFRALADKGINVQMITTSQIKISVVVARKSARQALRAVHEAFGLHVPPAAGGTAGRPDDRTAAKPPPDPFKLAARLVARLQRMEKLIVEGIDLGRVAVAGYVRRLARHARRGRRNVRQARRGGHRRGHDRAEHRPRQAGRHHRHRAGRRFAEDRGDCRDVAPRARRERGPPIPRGWPSCRSTAWA